MCSVWSCYTAEKLQGSLPCARSIQNLRFSIWKKVTRSRSGVGLSFMWRMWVWRHLKERGFDPPQPQNASWGERYFDMRDPDGHELSFARPLTCILSSAISLALTVDMKNTGDQRLP